METLLTDILTHGLTPPLAMALLQLIVLIFIATAIRNTIGGIVARRLAYRRLTANKYLKAGCWVEWPTTTGSIMAQVDRITPDEVVLHTGNPGKWVHIPILLFTDCALTLPDTEATA